jgi:hypothetical protein
MGRSRHSSPLLLLAALWVASAAAAPPAPSSHALLIGIQQYSAPGLNPLDGPVNDIALMRELLETRFRVPKENIVTLIDAQATHTGIQKAFATLAERVDPGDFVYIHYSGHGSQARDQNGDEPSGWDQTWVGYGARANKLKGLDDYDVLDDEINEWLIPLYQKTDRVVFVSDSCHSASVSRGELRGVRAAPVDPRAHPLAAKSFKTAAAPGARIGSARDIENAVELSQGDKTYGLYTWYWAETLDQARPGETWDDAFKRAYTLVTTQRGAFQRPQMEGHANWPVFGGRFEALAPTVAVTKVDQGSATAALAVGAANGATPKSLYRLYQPAGAKAAEPTPTIELTEVGAYASLGVVKQGRLKVGDLVVEAEHAYPFEPIKVAVEGDDVKDRDRALAERVEGAVKGLKGFELVGTRSRADWVAYVFRPVRDRSGNYVYESKAYTLPRSSPEQPPEVWVISTQEKLLHDKMRVSLKDPEPGIATLAGNLAAFARAEELRRLTARGAPPPVTVTAFPLQPAPGCDQDCVRLPDQSGGERAYRKQTGRPLEALGSASFKRGDILSFAVKNDGRDPLYIYLLNIGPDADVHAIFPAPYQAQQDARFEAGESRDLSEQTALLLNMRGTEMIKMLATSEPVDVRLFELAGYREVQEQRGGALNPLERLLAAAMYTRGQVMFVTPKSWGTAQAEFPVTD